MGTHPQLFSSTIEVFEIIPYRHAKSYENVSFLTDLYLVNGWSLRRISKELGCSKATVRKKLIAAGIKLVDRINGYELYRAKIKEMREKGHSFQQIAIIFNLWGIKTRTGEGKWHAKTVRDISVSQSINL